MRVARDPPRGLRRREGARPAAVRASPLALDHAPSVV